ncbi:hypothetical protein V5799_020722, partial [Amblyomma americanum]
MNEELTELGKIEMVETPEIQKASLEKLRRLLEEEDDLRIPPDDVLLKFLRCRKYRIQDASRTVKNYFCARRDIPEYFDNLTPSSIPYKAVIQDHELLLCPKERDPQGRAVVVLRSGAWKRELCSMDDFVRCCLVGAEYVLLDCEAQIQGVVVILDLQGLAVRDIAELTPTFLRRVLALMQA